MSCCGQKTTNFYEKSLECIRKLLESEDNLEEVNLVVATLQCYHSEISLERHDALVALIKYYLDVHGGFTYEDMIEEVLDILILYKSYEKINDIKIVMEEYIGMYIDWSMPLKYRTNIGPKKKTPQEVLEYTKVLVAKFQLAFGSNPTLDKLRHDTEFLYELDCDWLQIYKLCHESKFTELHEKLKENDNRMMKFNSDLGIEILLRKCYSNGKKNTEIRKLYEDLTSKEIEEYQSHLIGQEHWNTPSTEKEYNIDVGKHDTERHKQLLGLLDCLI